MGNENNVNNKTTEASEAKEREKVTDSEAKGGADELDGEGIAESNGAGNRSHGEGLMESNGDGDGDAGRIDEGESPPKADEGIVYTDKREGTKEVDQPMEEG